MKNQLKFRFVFLLFLGVFFITPRLQNLHAQEVKKNKVRLKADYFKIMNGESYLNLKATSKIEKKNTEVPNIDFTIYNIFDDEKITIGTAITDMDGKSKFIINSLSKLKPDSTGTFNLSVVFKGNDAFKKASKDISFKDAVIEAELITKDSLNYINAKLIDKSIDSVIVNESLGIQVERLFKSLRIGEEFNYTDENGTVLVPIKESIPGVDGNLIFEVILKDHDEFGTVKALVNAPIGVPIVTETTFDKRTLWSPRNKTPLFILVFANLLILGMWGIIVYLMVNLFKIKNA